MLAQDNANLFWHQANASLGIGTTSPLNGLTVSKSSTSQVRIDSINTHTTSSTAHAWLVASVGGAGGGDPVVIFDVFGVLNWAVGIDNSDSDKFKIASSAALGTFDRLTITTAGLVDIPGSLTCPLYSSTSTLTVKTQDKTNSASASVSIGTGDVGGSSTGGSGTLTIETGDGSPNTSGTESAGDSGAVTVATGPGGNSDNGSTAGNSGNLNLKTGSGGGNLFSGATGGNAGHIILQPGSGGSGTMQGAGGSTIVRASNSGDILAVQNSAGTTTHLGVANNGNVRVGAPSSSARLHLGAGTSTLPPLKLTAGTLLSSPAVGAMEFDGADLFITNSSAKRRFLTAQVANVLDFGAKGDDSADDAQAFRDAVASLVNTGGIVWVPPGRKYVINSQVDIRSYYPIFIVSEMGRFAKMAWPTLPPNRNSYIRPGAPITTGGMFRWARPDPLTDDDFDNGGGGMLGVVVTDPFFRSQSVGAVVLLDDASYFWMDRCLIMAIKGRALHIKNSTICQVTRSVLSYNGNTNQPCIEGGLYLRDSFLESNYLAPYIKTVGTENAWVWNTYFEANLATADTNQYYIDGTRMKVWSSWFGVNSNAGGLIRGTAADNYILNSEVNAGGTTGPNVTFSGNRSAVVGCNIYWGSTSGAVVLSGQRSRCIGNLFDHGGGVNTSGGGGNSVITGNVFGANMAGAAVTSAAGDVVDNNVGYGGGSAPWDPGNLDDGAGETSAAIAVTGAAFGDFVDVAAPYDLQGITCNGYVSSAGNVKIRLQNETGAAINLGSDTWKVRVRKG